MKTAVQKFAEELAELRAIARDYRAMKADRDAELRAWRKAWREHVDIIVASADPLPAAVPASRLATPPQRRRAA
jgi:hypothetical protein